MCGVVITYNRAVECVSRIPWSLSTGSFVVRLAVASWFPVLVS